MGEGSAVGGDRGRSRRCAGADRLVARSTPALAGIRAKPGRPSMMRMRTAWGVMVAGVAVAGLTMAAVAGDPPAEKSASGKSLVVPDAAAKKGTVYYCIPEH